MYHEGNTELIETTSTKSINETEMSLKKLEQKIQNLEKIIKKITNAINQFYIYNNKQK